MRPIGRTVYVVAPTGVDDPTRPSGGNVYDRRLCDELADRGWLVQEHPVPGAWPHPGATDQALAQRVLDHIPDGAHVVVDGLVGSAASAVPAAAGRLRLTVLIHMPLAHADPDPRVAAAEQATLAAAHHVVTTSHWCRDWLHENHGIAAERLRVVEPGTDPRPLTEPSPTGHRLSCVAALTPDKGHETLVAALARLRDLDWQCTCVGADDIDPDFAAQLRHTVTRAGLATRMTFPGAMPPAALDEIRATSDLAVSASRRESYGMAIAEALGHGIPVVATAVDGQPEAVGWVADRTRPGLLVPRDDPDALAEALGRWLIDAGLRDRLRRAAVRRRDGLPTWAEAAARFETVLTGREPGAPESRIPRRQRGR
jgi:glycosyltransferase involved in cell wall biosynthesis